MNVTIENTYRKLHKRLIDATALAGAYFPTAAIGDALRLALEEIEVISFEQNKLAQTRGKPFPEMMELKDVPVGTYCINNGTPAVWNGEEFEPVQSYLDDLGEELEGVRKESNRKSAILEGILDETIGIPYPPPLMGEVRIVQGLGISVNTTIGTLGGRQWVRFRDHIVNLTEENEKLSSELEVEKQRGNGLAVDLASAVTGRDRYKAEESRLQKLLTECQNSRKDWQEKADAAHNREQRLIERAELAEGRLEAANSLIVKQLEAIKAARRAWLALQPAWTGEDEYPYAYLLEGVEE